MLNRIANAALALMVVFGITVPTAQSFADPFTDSIAKAIEDGTIKLGFRYRYEFVDQDSFDDDAHANTLRTRLTFAPKVTDDWGFLLEFDDVRRIGSASFNDTRNGKTDRPTVADPKGTDLNQMAIRYAGWENATILLGRQRINRTNQRFIGGVGWRQNEQTYDSLSLGYQFNSKLNGYYAYVAQVNRIFGPDSGSPPEDLDTKIHLIDLDYTITKQAKVTGYAYLMDFEDADALSNYTLGVRLTGSLDIQQDLKLAYTGELAYQEDYADNPLSYDANYYLLEGALNWSSVGVKLGYEVLEGGDLPGEAFRTPLATLHKFQGWADKFIGPSTSGNPPNGIEDLYVTATAKAWGANFSVTYHDFSAEGNSNDLGSEFDAAASYAFLDHYSVLFKLASFDADDFSDDTTKFWLMLTATF
jgi:hypothetical protein